MNSCDDKEYREGTHEEFIQYLFTGSPKENGSIILESPLNDMNKNIGLHIFEQLLMIFVDGLKHFYADKDGKIDISVLTIENIEKVNSYFLSMNYKVNIEVFETIHSYIFKFPNYFKNQENIKKDTKLDDFYYELFDDQNVAFRITFANLN